jgi:LuxR family transcriptional regulator, maltose regulon positive regulatory protein
MPWLAVMTRLVLARSAVRTGDEETARALAREAAELRGRIPDSPVLTAGTEALIGIVEGLGTPERGATALTAAELRVLEFLPTHLTFREIGERLHLSRFTIKSQALAAYRKLGATSRSEAVTRARRLGLLDEDPLLRAAAS